MSEKQLEEQLLQILAALVATNDALVKARQGKKRVTNVRPWVLRKRHPTLSQGMEDDVLALFQQHTDEERNSPEYIDAAADDGALDNLPPPGVMPMNFVGFGRENQASVREHRERFLEQELEALIRHFDPIESTAAVIARLSPERQAYIREHPGEAEWTARNYNTRIIPIETVIRRMPPDMQEYLREFPAEAERVAAAYNRTRQRMVAAPAAAKGKFGAKGKSKGRYARKQKHK